MPGSSKVYPVLPNGEWLDLAPTAFDDTPPGDVVALEPGESKSLVWHPEDADSLPPVCGENYGVRDWSAA